MFKRYYRCVPSCQLHITPVLPSLLSHIRNWLRETYRMQPVLWNQSHQHSYTKATDWILFPGSVFSNIFRRKLCWYVMVYQPWGNRAYLVYWCMRMIFMVGTSWLPQGYKKLYGIRKTLRTLWLWVSTSRQLKSGQNMATMNCSNRYALFSIWNFRRVLNVVCFRLGYSPASVV
jgi:hypothetical protein